MKTKREVLKEFVTYGDCNHTKCENCSYSIINNFNCKLHAGAKLSQIGAMAILRMFKEKKKPIFTVGTEIKFDNGETATLVFLKKEYWLMFANHKEKLDYLVNKTWEIVE